MSNYKQNALTSVEMSTRQQSLSDNAPLTVGAATLLKELKEDLRTQAFSTEQVSCVRNSIEQFANSNADDKTNTAQYRDTAYQDRYQDVAYRDVTEYKDTVTYRDAAKD